MHHKHEPSAHVMVEQYIRTVEEHRRKVVTPEGLGFKITHVPLCQQGIHP
jgi:hypothetical protein